MRSDSGPANRYVVRISRNGDAFAWEIYREADSIVVHRSARLFATRIEALLDSARAAATLSIDVIEPPSGEDDNHNCS